MRGIQGATCPPSSGYNPDAWPYVGPKTDAMPPLDDGQYSGQTIVETPNGRMVCSKPDYAGRVFCQ